MDEVIGAKRQQSGSAMRAITIRGAREHNLKNIDVEIPRDTLTVLTGLSGSGKSSLAFDTIYAEGQRRYVESLSAYARQFLELMQKPDVDHIEGLSPAISIEQKTTSKNPRSTVGTVTEIYDYLRLLFARVGVPYSPATGLPIESQTVSQMADRILALPEGTRLYLLAPIVRGRKGEYRKELAELHRRKASSASRSTANSTTSAPRRRWTRNSSTISRSWSTVSWCKPDIGNRLAESIETALKLADGLLWSSSPIRRRTKREKDETAKIHDRAANDLVLRKIRLPGVRLHHFGNRAAAVLLQQPAWRLPGMRRAGGTELFRRGLGGAGRKSDLRKGAIAPWAKSSSPYYLQTLEALARHYKFSHERALGGPAQEGAERDPARLGR